jgi:4-amino-4-deoxy-L-arabinose transferase-like glycosyltransferase
MLFVVAIVILSATLRFANLSAIGYANHYYTAAVESMLKSWHNFFFVAAEPGGSVSVDKPPVGLWIQVISAYFLGVNGFSVVLPQILAGILSVIVVYHLVRRSFGTVAGLLAALALGITPIVIATDRNNTIDSTLILTLLLAAWAFIKATESGRFRYLLLGAALVGIGFNIKMLQAYLPLPAFFALYFLGSAERLWRKVGKLALASVLLLAVSLSWATAVDLTPADQRPYVGSSGDNSETSLILVYNGIDRLLGMFGRRGGANSGGPAGGLPAGGSQGPAQNGIYLQGRPRANNGYGPQDGFPSIGQDGNNDGFPYVQPDGINRSFPKGVPYGSGGGFPQQGGLRNNAGSQSIGSGGLSGIGQAGALRFFIPPLSKEVSWLLPFGLVSTLLLLFGSRWHWPITPNHQGLVLWGGWLLTCVVFFSVAGFFHEYYLSMLAAPLAALVAVGVVQLWRLRKQHPWLAVTLLLAAAGGTLAFQLMTAQSFVRNIWWLPLTLAIFAIGALLLIAATISRKLNRLALASFACIVAAILVTPGIWSALTNLNTSANQSLPSAYSGQSSGPANRGGLQVNQALLDYLELHTQNTYYLMAVPSSMQGADYVLATGRPVLYLGGFMGQDQVLTTDELAQMIQQGELRYIYWNSSGQGSGNQSDISSWVTSTCTAVQGFDTATRNTGAPDGTTAGSNSSTNGQNNGFSQGPGNLQDVSLYECGN